MRLKFTPLMLTSIVLLLLFTAASLRFPGFAAPRVVVGFFTDQAVLALMALGLSFVIFTGGIDLSIGSAMAFAGIATVWLLEKTPLPDGLALMIPLVVGTLAGYVQGRLIADLKLPPFLVTLGGLFVFQGFATLLAEGSMQSASPLLAGLVRWNFKLGDALVSLPTVLFVMSAVILAWVARQTLFGRTSLAIGGDATSAMQMGLPVRRTTIGVYALSGFTAAVAGLIFVLYTGSGDPISGTGRELEAISAVVIGGTLLRGGRGSIFGTVLGVLTIGIIQMAVIFDGTLSAWWARIVIAALLGLFLVAQSLLGEGRRKAAAA